MNLQPDTLAVLSHLNSITQGALRKQNDLGVILELSASRADSDAFNNLTRTGMGLWKVYRMLRSLRSGDDGFSTLEREFGSLVNDLREQLASLVVDADDDVLRRFDDTYFGMTQGVVRNLVDLSHDLARIKELQNSAR
jgi:hypothetical protein